MRTTKNLIDELHYKADGAFVAGIVVGIEDKTEIVWADALDPMGDLNALMDDGGEPIAMCRIEKTAKAMIYSVQALDEYADQDWVNEYLERLCACVANLFMAETDWLP